MADRQPARIVVAVLVAAVAAGCARRNRLPEPPPVPPVADPGLTVTLVWDAPVDLDLYVTEPGLETVYFANRRSAHGGELARDARCADLVPGEGRPPAAGPRIEQVRWAAPPAGRYRVAVDFIETCGDRRALAVTYRVAADADGRREERTGRARLAERDPRVLEFTVGGTR